MKRGLFLLLAFMVLLTGSAFAAEGGETETVTAEADGTNITVNVTVEAPEQTPVPVTYTSYSLTSDPPEDVTAGADEDSLRLPELLDELFGAYQPKVQTVEEHLEDGSVVSYQQYVPGAAGIDWDWLAAVGLFALVLFCVFKLIGGLLKL